jgi:hypothetical protein
MSQNIEVIGNIKRIEATKEVGANNFKTREVVVTTEEQYPQTLSIQFVQDKTSLLDNFQPNQKVKITVNLKGRENTKDGKTSVFNTIQGWKIEGVS